MTTKSSDSDSDLNLRIKQNFKMEAKCQHNSVVLIARLVKIFLIWILTLWNNPLDPCVCIKQVTEIQ